MVSANKFERDVASIDRLDLYSKKKTALIFKMLYWHRKLHWEWFNGSKEKSCHCSTRAFNAIKYCFNWLFVAEITRRPNTRTRNSAGSSAEKRTPRQTNNCQVAEAVSEGEFPDEITIQLCELSVEFFVILEFRRGSWLYVKFGAEGQMTTLPIVLVTSKKCPLPITK